MANKSRPEYVGFNVAPDVYPILQEKRALGIRLSYICNEALRLYLKLGKKSK